MRRFVGSLIFCCFFAIPIHAQQFYVASGGAARSQVNLNILQTGGEYPLINLLKTAQNLTYVTGGGTTPASPNDLDSNGYPVFCTSSCWSTNGGVETVFFAPSQAERPGHYVLSWIGGAKFDAFETVFTATNTSVTCAGTSGTNTCDSSACTPMTGSIALNILTVTVAPGGTGTCSTLTVRQPISAANIIVSQFGVPTTIIGKSGSANCPSCTGTGGTGTYLVNYSQTVTSESINPGGYYEWSISSETTTGAAEWKVEEISTNSGNTAQYISFYHIDDAADYLNSPVSLGATATGSIFGTLFKQRIAQGNFNYLRDLNTANANQSSCTTWATRTPTAYWSYYAGQMPSAIFAGTTSNSGNAYTATSANFGSGNFTDKAQIIVLWNATASNNSPPNITFSLNGNTPVPILNAGGAVIAVNQTFYFPTINKYEALVYDAALGGLLHFIDGPPAGINCGMPPEAFLQLNYELGTNPEIVGYYLSLDPMTDYFPSYANLIKTTFPNMVPAFETEDEIWNTANYVGVYAEAKATAYAALDPAWTSGEPGSLDNSEGKWGSTFCQAINGVLGSMPHMCINGVQTTTGGSTATSNAVLLSTAYMNQSTSNIPIQVACIGANANLCPSPFLQQPAYKYVTNVAVANYWGLNETGTQAEVADSYNYFNGSAATQATIMANYMATGISGGTHDLAQINVYYNNWTTWMRNCAGAGGLCPLANANLIGYEGTFANSGTGLLSADVTTPIAYISNNATATVYTTAANGCLANMVLGLTGVAGGTWSASYSGLVVQSTVTNGCVVNLNSSGLGNFGAANTTASGNWTTGSSSIAVVSCSGTALNQTVFDATSLSYLGTVKSCVSTTLILNANPLAAGSSSDGIVFAASTLTYTGSEGTVNYLRENSYLSPQLYTATLLNYSNFLAAGGINPSQFTLAGAMTVNGTLTSAKYPWLSWAFDIYGYFPLATCTSCTISTTTLTLGGTVAGIFGAGQTIFGKNVTSPTTITGSCITSGPGPCGSNSGDTLALSQSSTVGTGESMSGNATPPANYAGTSTTSPIPQWGAICHWNGNTNACNGG